MSTEDSTVSEERKHTPGPWNVAVNDSSSVQENGVTIATTRTDDTYNTNANERAARARLIAAAPDLLALLVELTDIEGPLPGNAAWARKVKAAISKVQP